MKIVGIGGNIMPEVAAIVQARMGSSRLSGKVATVIEGKSMLAHLIERLKDARLLDQLIIATSTKQIDDPVASIAAEEGVICYRGSERNVFSRYLEAGEQYDVDVIVRITGDCPLIDPVTVDGLVSNYLDSDYDYMRLNVGENGYPRGLDAEIFSYQTLLKVNKMLKNESKASLEQYREHVTLYIYKHPDSFSVASYNPPENLQRNYRLCVDESADLQLITEIYERLYKKEEIIDIKKVIELLDNNPDLAGINSDVMQKKV
ncbi:MAG: 3-deoxy-manno-octulosonate cytidylyltransferase [Firmicutes bacterium]|nr:3-deoxy-manno-octulosonate cytidylyltransferase [Bacillota bacterium]